MTEVIDLQSEEKKAKNGDGLSAYILGRCYARGLNGVKRNFSEAFRWYDNGSRFENNCLCTYGLGICYRNGQGVEKNEEKEKDYLINAFPLVEKMAKENNPYAQFCVGAYYNYNFGDIKKDIRQAIFWYKKAADQGHSTAQHNLGTLYYKGEDVQQDYKKAVRFFEESAISGEASAQNNFGLCYHKGHGVTQSYEKAVEWFKKSAEQLHSDGQFNLGLSFYSGLGVNEDYTNAAMLFAQSALQGNRSAQYYFGLCYENGYGILQDITKAKDWYEKSASNGYIEAKNALLRLA